MTASISHVVVVSYEFKIGRKWTKGVDVYADRADAEHAAQTKEKLPFLYRKVEVAGHHVFSAGIHAANIVNA